MNVLPQDPAARLIPLEREYHQPRVLTEAEYHRLQLACAHETRDAAIIELLLQTGMHLAEVTRLTLADVELPARIAEVEFAVRVAEEFVTELATAAVTASGG